MIKPPGFQTISALIRKRCPLEAAGVFSSAAVFTAEDPTLTLLPPPRRRGSRSGYGWSWAAEVVRRTLDSVFKAREDYGGVRQETEATRMWIFYFIYFIHFSIRFGLSSSHRHIFRVTEIGTFEKLRKLCFAPSRVHRKLVFLFVWRHLLLLCHVCLCHFTSWSGSRKTADRTKTVPVWTLLAGLSDHFSKPGVYQPPFFFNSHVSSRV